MAYIPNNLSVVSATIEGNWNTAVYIHPSDSLATVTGANYISDGQQRGLENGDIVWAILNNVAYLLQVSASQTLPSLGVTLSGVAGGVANGSLPPAQYSTAALQSTAMTAAQVAGAATTVFDNTGAVLTTTGATGAAFSDAQLGFTITAGGTAFVAGDGWTINVNKTLAGETYVAWDPAGTDGSERAKAILGFRTVTGASATAQATVINGHATVRLADLTWKTGATQAQIDQAMRKLGEALIKFR